ncbi:MAG: potassium/proton antiporter [Geodermatophilaceae bacterium]|nr:potassium/proton antiporter [Geodermatophilaceae bacterium]MDQ3454125.1 potassium/proton antiporter [Actinomycetota bacterium]
MNEGFTVALLIGALVVLAGALAVRVSTRLGLPSLLLYLGLGVLLGESVIGLRFDDAELTRTLGICALVVILAEGGLTTRWTAVRDAVPRSIVLSTLGVAVSIVVAGAASVLALGVDWRTGLLLGAVVSSTDAAAVFSTLRGLGLPRRVTATLELESGLNDAPVVIIVVLLSSDAVLNLPEAGALLVYELIAGAAIGIAMGFLGAWVLRRSALPASGLYPLATVAFCVAAYAAADVAHASGFLAVYVAGLVLGNSRLPHRRATLGFAEGLAWLSQIGLFVLLGLLVSPSRLLNVLVPAVVIGLALLLVARPLSLLASMAAFRVPWREQAFLSWAGLRGAVPIVFATIPVTEGSPDALRLFDIVFVLVVVFTLVQGTTLPAVARVLGVAGDAPTQEIEVESAPLEELGADLLQVKVPPESRLHGVYVSELRLPEDAAVTLIVREGHSFVPGATTRILRGDELLVVTTSAVRDRAENRLRAVSRAGRLAGWRGERGRADPSGP